MSFQGRRSLRTLFLDRFKTNKQLKHRSHINRQINNAVIFLVVLIMNDIRSGQLLVELLSEFLQGRSCVVRPRFHFNGADVMGVGQ